MLSVKTIVSSINYFTGDYMNNSIKKDFIAIVELLEANANKKVSSIMPQILELVTKRASGGSDIGKTFIKNDEGVVTHIYCISISRREESLRS